jgi:hypothetical protein
MTIKINNENIRIRPSAIENFYGCAYQWGKSHLEGISSIANSRAAIGTAIHAGVEAMWTEAMASKKKEPNIRMMTDAAIDSWKEQTKEGVQFGDGESEGTCAVEIIKGTQAFVEDIVPFTVIPKAVEKFFEVKLNSPFIDSVGGTIDYLSDTTIGDVKTTKRKSGAEGHSVQQSTYTYLANANGENIANNVIQQIVLKKEPEGAILLLEPDIEHAKYLINGMLDVLDVVYKDIVPIEVMLRPNPKYMFCSEKYCAHYKTCPGVRGNLKASKVPQTVKL